jgi:hypothetical protein
LQLLSSINVAIPAIGNKIRDKKICRSREGELATILDVAIKNPPGNFPKRFETKKGPGFPEPELGPERESTPKIYSKKYTMSFMAGPRFKMLGRPVGCFELGGPHLHVTHKP